MQLAFFIWVGVIGLGLIVKSILLNHTTLDEINVKFWTFGIIFLPIAIPVVLIFLIYLGINFIREKVGK